MKKGVGLQARDRPIVGSVRMSLCRHSHPNSDDWVTGNPNVEARATLPRAPITKESYRIKEVSFS